MESEYVRSDQSMYEKMGGVYAILESFRDKEVIDQESVLRVLEIQELAKEIQSEEAPAHDS